MMRMDDVVGIGSDGTNSVGGLNSFENDDDDDFDFDIDDLLEQQPPLGDIIKDFKFETDLFLQQADKIEAKLNWSSDQLSFLDDLDLSDCDGVKSAVNNDSLPDLKTPQEHDPIRFFDGDIGHFPATCADRTKENEALASPTTSAGLKIKPDPEVLTDCMWSADARYTHKTKDRKRDVSVTLSECANGLATITGLEMLDIFGRTPPVEGLEGSSNLIWNPLNDASETESDNEEEEIDVVTSNDDDDVKPWVKKQQQQTSIDRIQPGRSLLLVRNRSPAKPDDLLTNHPVFIDHCYFAYPPKSPIKTEVDDYEGVLTPTESSDDEKFLKMCDTIPSIDKAKIVQAVKSLIVRSSSVSSSAATGENVKFRFRMKFKARSPPRRRSTPSVVNKFAPKMAPTPKPSPTKVGRVSKSPTTSFSSTSSSSEKCREIRDLHNSMERQRRVDLRRNFDKLKAAVPELADSEKASKLNILNKATNYCLLLTNLEKRLANDRASELAKNARLRKRLSALMKY